MNETVSVILTCFNGERWLPQTLDSVRNQSYDDWKLIVVNDGSADGSQAVIDGFDDPRVRRIVQANRGIPGARNRGLAEAKGAYVAILDQDDLWHPMKLARQVAYLTRRPDVAVVYTNADHIDAEGYVIGSRYGAAPGDGRLLETFLRAGFAVPIVTTLIRRECLDAVGAFDERLYGWDDYDLLVRLAARFRFGYIEERLTQLRYHRHSAWASDRMLMDGLVVADLLASRFPEHAGAIRRFRSTAHRQYGDWLVRRGDVAAGRRHLWAAVALAPWRWRALARWLCAAAKPARAGQTHD